MVSSHSPLPCSAAGTCVSCGPGRFRADVVGSVPPRWGGRVDSGWVHRFLLRFLPAAAFTALLPRELGQEPRPPCPAQVFGPALVRGQSPRGVLTGPLAQRSGHSGAPKPWGPSKSAQVDFRQSRHFEGLLGWHPQPLFLAGLGQGVWMGSRFGHRLPQAPKPSGRVLATAPAARVQMPAGPHSDFLPARQPVNLGCLPTSSRPLCSWGSPGSPTEKHALGT